MTAHAHKYNSSPGWIHLKDGTAANKKFFVQRAPIFLRVAQDVKGDWDVLDLIDDTPHTDEEVFVYRQVSWVHIRADRREDSGYHYNYVEVPITREEKATLRHNSKWQKWTKQHASVKK